MVGTIHWDSIMMILVAYFPVVLVHELGHYLVARLQGAPAGVIRVGSPTVRGFNFQLGRLTLALHPGLGLWFDVPVCLPKDRPTGPARNLAFFAAGPGLALLLFFFLLPTTASDWESYLARLTQGRFGNPISSWAMAFSAWSLWFTLYPLLPLRYANGLLSDGAQIIRAVRELYQAAAAARRPNA